MIGGAQQGSAATGPATTAQAGEPDHYEMRISRLTVDKLGVKLYDKASAVVAELVANSYDADAENVIVEIPLGTELATRTDSGVTDSGHTIIVRDDGHGLTPREAQDYFLVVGTDRRNRPGGQRSRSKQRAVMGRKGIGKLSPFGICRRIEVLSAGGDETAQGYRVSHFVLDFNKIVEDSDGPVPIAAGPRDKTWVATHGTEVRLSNFLPKRVPSDVIFLRQIARRFALSAEDFTVTVTDSRAGGSVQVPKFEIAVDPTTRIDVAGRPVPLAGAFQPVTGWLAFAREAYKDEEMAGVRIYARGKIVATTRDFEQPAGFTSEFAARSYLVGEVHAEWLDKDDGEDLVRTDRQGILWDSEAGEALRSWGMTLIREIAQRAAGPRRTSKSKLFLAASKLEERAKARYGDQSVVDAVVSLGEKIGGFASEDELADEDYVEGLAEIVLSVAPHQALIAAFKTISGQEDKDVDDLLTLFGKTRVAEMASYAQIASERVHVIKELQQVIDAPGVQERDLQNLIARAPWLVQPSWSVITENQGLKTFRDRFVKFWKERYSEDLEVAISFESKRPDFTLVHVGTQLHIVELKKPGHAFADEDYGRLENYLEAFEEFFGKHQQIAAAFAEGWVVDLVADDVKIKDTTKRRAFTADEKEGRVVRRTWDDFLVNARTTHEQFLQAHDQYQGHSDG